MNRLITCIIFVFLSAAIPAFAASDVETLKEELKKMTQTMELLQKKIEVLEKKGEDEKEEVQYLSDRMDKAELHTVTDKVSFSVDLRTDAHSMHYDDMRVAPSSLITNMLALSGQNRATIMGALAGGLPPVEKYDTDNEFIPTTKFHLNMHSRVNNNLSFAGRLAAYKAWGDSSGVKFNAGSLGDVTLDGNTSSVPHGDTIRLERAYFVYSGGTELPFSFSLGRRPSTDGPPLEYGRNSMEAGSPLAPIINWQFDGASLSFGLEDLTGIPGAAFKLCYGLGFEGDWGNSYSLQNTSADVEDVHMIGFIATLYDDDIISAQLNYAHAEDITDGFTGLTVMPLIVGYDKTTGNYTFSRNEGGYISRMEPQTEIGDWDGASLLLRGNLEEWTEKDIDVFLAFSWSHTDPSNISQNPFYKLMGQGLLSSNDQLESRHGYSIYAGILVPMPMDAKLGFEYNWGSKYWFNFTGAEDSLAGSKLAARGQVFETYYIQPIVKKNLFLKIGGKFYDYEYTGSGNPLGAPVKVDEANSMDAFFPVIDKVWDLYASVNYRF